MSKAGRLTCPTDFNKTPNDSCVFKCPRDFKYLQASGGLPNRCVHQKHNDKFVQVNSLVQFRGAETSAYGDERQRVNAELSKIRTDIQTVEASQSALIAVQSENAPFSGRYAGAQAQYDAYAKVGDLATQVKATTDALKPPRQPVAPKKNIEEERRSILALSTRRIELIQVALFTVLIMTVVYVVLPFSWAHGVAFLIACGGVALGIFLTSK